MPHYILLFVLKYCMQYWRPNHDNYCISGKVVGLTYKPAITLIVLIVLCRLISTRQKGYTKSFLKGIPLIR